MWKSILAFLGGERAAPGGRILKKRGPLSWLHRGAAVRLVQEHGRGKVFFKIDDWIDKNWQNSDAESPCFVDCIQFHRLQFVKNRVGQMIQNLLTNPRDYSIL